MSERTFETLFVLLVIVSVLSIPLALWMRRQERRENAVIARRLLGIIERLPDAREEKE
jgi:hypothetical protein